MSIIMIASLTGLFLAIGLLYTYDRYMIKNNMIREMNILGEVIADRSTAALSFDDNKLATENLAALQAQPAVMLACIYDKNKKPFARYTGRQFTSLQCPETIGIDGHTFVDNELQVTIPILLSGNKIGAVFIILSTSEIQLRLQQYLIVILVIIVVVSALVYLLSNQLPKPILHPLLQLTAAAKSIAKNKDYSIRVGKESSDEIGVLVDAFNDMLQQIAMREKQRDAAENELQRHREHLEELVSERTSELESFCYSVSHDLRTPLRAINGYSHIIMDEYHGLLDKQGLDSLMRVRRASVHMGELIDDLLNLSRTSRHKMTIETVDLSALAHDIALRLQADHPVPAVDVRIEQGLIGQADSHLIRIALENLLGNAWKYTGKTPQPTVEFGMLRDYGEPVYYVRDNGAGFEMQYVGRLFGPFQRLHTSEEFEGSGIGLAIVARIIKRHGGRVWAEGKVSEGAVFYFTLGAINL